MKEKIDKFLNYFTTITKEESDYIESVLMWDDETKAAFFFAKRIFEEKDEEPIRSRNVKLKITERVKGQPVNYEEE